jgi:isopenicillin N synthase-like dioxygenase
MAADGLPVLDLAAYLANPADEAEATRLAAEIGDALENVGFFFLTGHGVDAELMQSVYTAAAAFHALPLEEKLEMQMDENRNGYMPLGEQVSSGRGKSQGKSGNAALFLRYLIEGEHARNLPDQPNRYPAALLAEGFEEVTTSYSQATNSLAMSLLPLFARALELPSPDTYFADAFSGAQSCLRMSNYPDPKTEPALGVGAHTDSGILTLLGQSDKPGLELCLPNGRWVQPQPMPGAYLVNSGDLLRRWTNHRWLSTLHRVVNLPNQERYAIPFFWNTNPGAPLPLLALHSVFIQRFSDLHGMAWLAMTRRVCDGGATWMRIREQPSAL